MLECPVCKKQVSTIYNFAGESLRSCFDCHERQKPNNKAKKLCDFLHDLKWSEKFKGNRECWACVDLVEFHISSMSDEEIDKIFE